MAGNLRVMVPQLMAEKDMNISDLARALSISWPTAQKLARGRLTDPRIEQMLADICELFEVQPGDFLIYRPDSEGDR